MYVQGTEEAFSSQKRPSNTSKHELLQIFFYFYGSFLPSWIRIRIPNPDPDPLARLNPDPIRIRNPAFFHPGSQIGTVSIPGPGSAWKNLSILTPKETKKWFLSSRKYDPGCSSRIRILTFYPSRIPDPGVKKAPDPGSGSATLVPNHHNHVPNKLPFHWFARWLLFVGSSSLSPKPSFK
jgi:hypothetical protein